LRRDRQFRYYREAWLLTRFNADGPFFPALHPPAAGQSIAGGAWKVQVVFANFPAKELSLTGPGHAGSDSVAVSNPQKKDLKPKRPPAWRMALAWVYLR
jgi:hypothetical protein